MPFLCLVLISAASAQAPLFQDGAWALRQARLDWALGQEPLGPSSMPSLEVGWGGMGSEGIYTPLTEGEGLGNGTQGWGLGLKAHYARGGWSIAATALALRDRGHTRGVLQRAAIAFQWESGWRAALEQMPFAWGTGLNGGDLLGDAAHPFPRLSLTTPEADLPWGRWRLETFLGRLPGHAAIPAWLPDREARATAEAAGLDLQKPTLWGGLARAAFGASVVASLGVVRLAGGQDVLGKSASSSATRWTSLAELRLNLPALAQLAQARGAALYVSRSAAPDSPAVTLSPARDLGGLQLVWDRWDLALEYAGAAPPNPGATFTTPSHLAGFSNQGDPLGSAFGRDAISRTVELGAPLFLEGQGRLKLARITTGTTGSWFLQGDALWRTPLGKVGASLASRREALPNQIRWGWTFTIFQAFRVF